MSSIRGQGQYDSNRHLNYISTAAFNANIFTYTVTQVNFVNTGTLSAVLLPVVATSVNCPAGTVLRTNGKKLYPSANPGIVTMMVGVFDYSSGISGFIDPNDCMFAIYNVDKPVDMLDGVDTTGHNTHKGPSLYTCGNVTAGGNVVATGGVTAGLQIVSTGVTALTSITANGAATTQAINPTLGQAVTFTVSPPSGVASITLTASSAPVGALVRVFIRATTVQNTTITFGTGFHSTGKLIVTAAAGPATNNYVITFVGDGTAMFEVSRTAAMA